MNKARTIKSYHSLPRKKGTFWPFPQNETLEISFGPSSSSILLLLKLDNIWRWQKNKKCRAATIRPPHLLLTEEAAVGLHLLLHAVVVDVVLLHVIYVSVRPSNLLFRRRHIFGLPSVTRCQHHYHTRAFFLQSSNNLELKNSHLPKWDRRPDGRTILNFSRFPYYGKFLPSDFMDLCDICPKSTVSQVSFVINLVEGIFSHMRIHNLC